MVAAHRGSAPLSMRLLAMLALAVADPTQRPTQGPTAGAAAPDAAAPWLAGFQHTWPCDVLFVKGKKVAGTTLGGVVRRLGKKHGVAFFAPAMPKIPPPDWRSGGRERWVLQEFETFVARRRGLVGWGQEQTLSPRKRGLDESSQSLMSLAERALRVTAVRDPVQHAISACTHFGPCGRRAEGVFGRARACFAADAGVGSAGPEAVVRTGRVLPRVRDGRRVEGR